MPVPVGRRFAVGVAAVSLAVVAPVSGCASSQPTAVSVPVTATTGAGTASTSSSTSRSSSSATTADDSSTSTTDAAALPAACTLLTEADVVAAVGEPVAPGDQRMDECWWSTANDLKTVNLIRRTGDIDEWRSGYDNSQWTPVPIGDEGYKGLTLDSIVFRRGETFYEINVVYSTAGDPGAVVEALAGTVVSRL